MHLVCNTSNTENRLYARFRPLPRQVTPPRDCRADRTLQLGASGLRALQFSGREAGPQRPSSGAPQRRAPPCAGVRKLPADRRGRGCPGPSRGALPLQQLGSRAPDGPAYAPRPTLGRAFPPAVSPAASSTRRPPRRRPLSSSTVRSPPQTPVRICEHNPVLLKHFQLTNKYFLHFYPVSVTHSLVL